MTYAAVLLPLPCDLQASMSPLNDSSTAPSKHEHLLLYHIPLYAVGTCVGLLTAPPLLLK
jgi:hypothetical protein